MSLVLYSDKFWFPSGALAANIAVSVFPQGSNALANLYADALGTTPLPNPVMTDVAGVLTFYATVGEYWIHIGSTSVLIDVGLSHTQSEFSTGIASGGELDAAGAQSIMINPLVGYITSNSGITSVNPTLTRVDFAGGVVPLSAASLSRSITWWLLDSASIVIQQATRPTATQRRTHLMLGVTFYDLNTLSIIEVQSLQIPLHQQANQFVDLMDSLGPFSITGNVISANGVNLQINKSAGTLFARSFNLFVTGVLNDNPHVSTSPLQTSLSFRRILRTPAVVTPPLVNTLDPANYDVGGVLTPVGGGVNNSTIQRVWLFATNDLSSQVVIQYGQTVYNSLANAGAAIGSGTFTPSPVTVDAALIGYIVVTRSATNLTDPTHATFIKSGKFATP